MNTNTATYFSGARHFAIVGLLALFLSACATTTPAPDGAAEVRNRLTALQNDPNLGSRARVEIRDAEQAVRLAEIPVSKQDTALGEHRVYMAERKVGIAEAKASANYAVSLRARLGEERDAARLRARTQEADRARANATRAEADAARSRDAAARSRNAAEQARRAEMQASNAAEQARRAEMQASSESAQKAAELQQRIDDLEAEATDRGLVLTLGDVLFSTGSAELHGGTNAKLNKLVTFLNEYPERKVAIEGHTDNVGSQGYNQGLSQRRADAVKTYLSQQGITSTRMSSLGMGMAQPISSNDNATGRQQNRRVEIVIEHASGT